MKYHLVENWETVLLGDFYEAARKNTIVFLLLLLLAAKISKITNVPDKILDF